MIPSCYVPKVGETVRMKLFEHYTTMALDAWTHFEVLDIPMAVTNEYGTRMVLEGDKYNALMVHARTTNVAVGKEPQPATLPIDWIAAPLYWLPVYEIRVISEEEAQKVWGWMEAGRGIRCMGSADLSSAGDRAFVPGDREKPHWKYDEGEVVYDPDRIKIILVTKHPVPTGNPDLTPPYTSEDYDKAKKIALKERKKVLADRKQWGVTVFNIKDQGCVFESWWESEEEWKKPPSKIPTPVVTT